MRVFASFAASTAPRAARWTRAVLFENARTAARSTGPSDEAPSGTTANACGSPSGVTTPSTFFASDTR